MIITELPLQEHITQLNEHLKPFPNPDTVFVPEQAWLKERLMPYISINLGELRPEWKGTVVHLVNHLEGYGNPIGTGREAFHNEFIGTNYLAFRLTENNQYEFLGTQDYFLPDPQTDEFKKVLTKDFRAENFPSIEIMQERQAEFCAEFVQWQQETRQIFTKHQAEFAQTGSFGYHDDGMVYGYYLDILGGKIWGGNWVDCAPIPPAFQLKEENWEIEITYQGKQFYHIASVAGYTYADGADSIILLYEPESRIVLLTYDYT